MRLADLRIGEKARIVSLAPHLFDVRKRLIALGLTPGVEVKLTRIAPLGDPLLIEVRGYQLSLRKSEAHLINLDKIKDAKDAKTAIDPK